MTDTTKYMADAMAALDAVKNDDELRAWDDEWTTTVEYLQLPERDVRRLENAYDAKLRYVWGIGAGE